MGKGTAVEMGYRCAQGPPCHLSPHFRREAQGSEGGVTSPGPRPYLDRPGREAALSRPRGGQDRGQSPWSRGSGSLSGMCEA